MKCLKFAFGGLLSAALLASAAQAHFIFAVAEPSDQPKVVKIYMSDLAEPDNPRMLTGIQKAEAWVTRGGSGMGGMGGMGMRGGSGGGEGRPRREGEARPRAEGETRPAGEGDARPRGEGEGRGRGRGEGGARGEGGFRGRAPLEPVELKLEGDELVGHLPENAANGTFLLRHTYGVMGRGEEPSLLVYYAKAYSSSFPGNWTEVKRIEEHPLEIVPEVKGNEVAFKVLWKGTPAVGSQVTVECPQQIEKQQGETNEKGIFRATLGGAGRYSVRARYIEQAEGELNGKAYKSVKYYSTLALPYAPPKVVSAEHQWPDLKQGTTSFGAAVVGDDLYVYGGNYGGGHQYSEEEQSGDFIKLNLKDGKDWEALPGGPKLTGLAMAAHGGKLYRVGGFTVKDLEEGRSQLNSQNSFARFDPAKGTWEDLAPLPEARSSHNVAVLGDHLYVIGGWTLGGSERNGNWLKTAYSIDLSAEKPEWKALPEAPFERRALAVAAHQGKIYVIGGMQNRGGTTPRVDIYDPETKTWSEGPAVQGSGMDGFGTAAFSVDGKLIATTMSGSIQALSADGSQWEYQGRLKSPRFFHEAPAWNHGLVIVGGTSMTDGKAESLEFLPIETVDASRKAALAE